MLCLHGVFEGSVLASSPGSDPLPCLMAGGLVKSPGEREFTSFQAADHLLQPHQPPLYHGRKGSARRSDRPEGLVEFRRRGQPGVPGHQTGLLREPLPDVGQCGVGRASGQRDEDQAARADNPL